MKEIRDVHNKRGKGIMKIRQGFVSNSSSSSFVVSKQFLSPDQIEKIKNHATLAEEMNLAYSEPPWEITEDSENVYGSTWMDNFEIELFLEKIGVDMERVDFHKD